MHTLSFCVSSLHFSISRLSYSFVALLRLRGQLRRLLFLIGHEPTLVNEWEKMFRDRKSSGGRLNEQFKVAPPSRAGNFSSAFARK